MHSHTDAHLPLVDNLERRPTGSTLTVNNENRKFLKLSLTIKLQIAALTNTIESNGKQIKLFHSMLIRLARARIFINFW